MKRFFDGITISVILAFVLGLVLSVIGSSWITLVWQIAGLLWVIIARLQELRAEDLEKEYDARLSSLRKDRDNALKDVKKYWDLYNDKQEQYEKLQEEYGNLSKHVIASAPADKQEPAKHSGNIRLKKKKSVPKVKTDNQDKTE